MFRSPPASSVPDLRLPALQAAAGRLDGMLRICEALLEAGRAIDVAGLEAQMGRLCAACLDLPPEQGRAMHPPLVDLLARLDLAEMALRRRGGT